MSEVKRYGFWKHGTDSLLNEFGVSRNGEYVLHANYAVLQAKLDEAEQRIRELTEERDHARALAPEVSE